MRLCTAVFLSLSSFEIGREGFTRMLSILFSFRLSIVFKCLKMLSFEMSLLDCNVSYVSRDKPSRASFSWQTSILWLKSKLKTLSFMNSMKR